MNKEYILETIHSKKTVEFPLYDINLIRNVIQKYYNKESDNINFIMHWLNFELFRNIFDIYIN